ncbi:MAG: anthranilate phosphoribosyltransferase [Litorimonas sp.]
MTRFGSELRAILTGQKSDSQIQTFLEDLITQGLTPDHVRIGVEIMRENMTPAPVDNAIDIVGTGGTGLHTYSISTASALVCAGAGARVAKHGNRAASSLTGTADTLSELGVNLAISPVKAAECVDKAGVGFLFAPNHHPAMRFVGPARKAIGAKTIFNLLGPMSNPASTKRMLVGVADDTWRRLMAEAFTQLGMEHVWVVHGQVTGHDGLDEITTTGPTIVSEVKNAKLSEFTITPESYDIPLTTIDSLRGGTPVQNAQALRELLQGQRSDYRDIVCLNSGAALMIAGLADDIAAGIDMARASIDNGKAKTALETLIEISNA